MEAIYLLFAFTIVYGVGCACGYGFRGLIHSHIAQGKTEAEKVIADGKAELDKLVAEAKAKL